MALSLTTDDLPDLPLLLGEARSDGTGEIATHRYAATGEATGQVRLASSAQVDVAVAAARAAVPRWRAEEPAARRDLLLKASDLLMERVQRLAYLTTIDTGLTRTAARGSVMAAAEWLRYYAGWVDKLGGQVIPTADDALDYVRYEPYGVIGVIVPWNGPVASAGMVLAPALAAGNCVVLKPSELTPYAMAEFAQLFLDAGFHPGVVNVVTGGRETGEALVRHPGIDKIHFTGSGAVAVEVLAASAPNLKPACLELGGKSANLVFQDADLDLAAQTVVRALTRQSGQSCVAGTRVIAHEAIADELASRAARLVGQLRIGDPMSEDTVIGPVVTSTACQRILTCIENAVADGAKISTGGCKVGGALSLGYFISPTILTDVDNASRIAQEETFGPVISVISFHDDDEAISLANATQFGLAAYIHTQNLSKAHRAAGRLDAGTVWINEAQPILPGTPFGGTKQSGFGRIGGREGFDEFVRPKNVWVRL
jgi:aldehyde dehydrogenase (NAD+)